MALPLGMAADGGEMSKFVSIAAAVLLAVTGVLGALHAPNTPTKPMPVVAHKVVEHHWSKTYPALDVTGCGLQDECTGLRGTFTKPPTAAQRLEVRYIGVQASKGIDVLSDITLPAAIARALTVDVSVRANVSIAGTKGHKFEIALCEYSSLSGPGCAFDQPYKALGSSGVAVATATLVPGSPQVAWTAVELTKGSTATVETYTVNITYYALD
jgi:hypothetical protein